MADGLTGLHDPEPTNDTKRKPGKLATSPTPLKEAGRQRQWTPLGTHTANPCTRGVSVSGNRSAGEMAPQRHVNVIWSMLSMSTCRRIVPVSIALRRRGLGLKRCFGRHCTGADCAGPELKPLRTCGSRAVTNLRVEAFERRPVTMVVTRTGAVVRKPSGKEPAGGTACPCRKRYGDLVAELGFSDGSPDGANGLGGYGVG